MGSPRQAGKDSDVPEDTLILQSMGTAQANLEWLAKNYEAVRERAAGTFVVVFNRRLVSFGASTDEAIRKSGLTPAQLRDALIDYVPAEGESWIL